MALSVFEDKTNQPAKEDLEIALGKTALLWDKLKSYAMEKNPDYYEEWSFSGKNYGWGFRVREKKRAIIYLTPNNGFFLFSVVFGEKATNEALNSNISKDIKDLITAAKVYGEGRGIRTEVRNDEITNDLKKLIDFKVKY